MNTHPEVPVRAFVHAAHFAVAQVRQSDQLKALSETGDEEAGVTTYNSCLSWPQAGVQFEGALRTQRMRRASILPS